MWSRAAYYDRAGHGLKTPAISEPKRRGQNHNIIIHLKELAIQQNEGKISIVDFLAAVSNIRKQTN